jgi:hypothetical protein
MEKGLRKMYKEKNIYVYNFGTVTSKDTDTEKERTRMAYINVKELISRLTVTD